MKQDMPKFVKVSGLSVMVACNGFRMSTFDILKWLKEHGYVVGEYSIVPSQKALDEGLLNMLVDFEFGSGENEGTNTEIYTLLISPKGQEFFVNEIRKTYGVKA